MSEYEDIKKQLTDEKNKLAQLEIEMAAIDSDTYFYQKNNDLDKLDELFDKKQVLISQFNSQKELVTNLETQFNSIKSKNDKKQSEEFKKEQEKIAQKNQEKIKKEKKIAQDKIEEENKTAQDNNKGNNIKDIFKKTKKSNNDRESTKTTQKPYKTYSNRQKCPKCGRYEDAHASFCQNCGYQLKKPRDGRTDNPNGGDNSNGNWFIRILLKKKNDEGSYRFSISKVIGTIYSILVFLTDLTSYYFPENIILSIISALFAYLICFIIGYIIRWVYNKYIK